MASRKEIVKKILEAEKSYSFSSRLEYALFLCLSPEVLGEIYVENLDDVKVRESAFKHIFKRIDEVGVTSFIPFVEQLFELLEKAEGRRKSSLRKITYELLPYLPINYATRFFDIMIDSPRKSDRKRACDVQNLNWTTERVEKVWSKWLEYGQEECLVILARFGNIDRVAGIFGEIWESQEISLKTKRILLKHMAKSHFTHIEFLQSEYPISYLYGRAIAEKPLDTAKAVELALTAKTTNELGFTLWCLGKLQQWDAIVQIFNRGEEIEQEFIDKIEQEFWEGQEELGQRGIKLSKEEQEKILVDYTRTRLYEHY